jgi:hypothetical protein
MTSLRLPNLIRALNWHRRNFGKGGDHNSCLSYEGDVAAFFFRKIEGVGTLQEELVAAVWLQVLERLWYSGYPPGDAPSKSDLAEDALEMVRPI